MNQILVALTLFSSIGFFNYHDMISQPVAKAAMYVCILVSMAMGITERNSSLKDVYYPRGLYFAVLACIVFSMLMADLFNGQSLGVTVKITMMILLPYTYFYALMRQGVAASKIIRLFICYILCSTVVFFCNLYTYPNNIFGEPLGEDFTRGIIRIPLVGGEIFVLLLFYGIDRWNDFRQKKWWLIIALCCMMIVLSVTRQLIGISFFIGLIMLLRHYSILHKIVIVAVVTAAVAVVVPRLPMYKSMMELSEMQAERHSDSKEDIRLQAWRFYTYESWDNPVEMIFGHGVYSTAGDSEWGNRMEAETDVNKCLLYDVGWAGFIYYFGLLGAGFLMALFIVTVRQCFRYRSKEYLGYWFIFLILTSVASAPILFFNQVIVVSLCLYLAYCPEDDVHYDSEFYYDPSGALNV